MLPFGSLAVVLPHHVQGVCDDRRPHPTHCHLVPADGLVQHVRSGQHAQKNSNRCCGCEWDHIHACLLRAHLSRSAGMVPQQAYGNMSAALNKTGHAVSFNMCEWGLDDPWTWGGAIAQSWRMAGDHTGVWPSTKETIALSAKIPANCGCAVACSRYQRQQCALDQHPVHHASSLQGAAAPTPGTTWTVRAIERMFVAAASESYHRATPCSRPPHRLCV